MIATSKLVVVLMGVMIAVTSCSRPGDSTEQSVAPTPEISQFPSTPDPASAITHPPADSAQINEMHAILRSEEGRIHFGT